MGLRTMLGLKKHKRPYPRETKPRLALSEPMPDVDRWYGGKQFTSDWTTHNLGSWLAALRPYQDRPVDVLEVGAYEGRSAVIFLEYLTQSRLTCIDAFAFDDPTLGKDVEERFDANMAGYGNRVTKIKQRAIAVMDNLAAEKALFDIIYLDAGKSRHGVFALSVMAWPLLRTNGIMIWDDLEWGPDKPSDQRPRDAIMLFQESFADCIDILHQDYQLIARKVSNWPSTATLRNVRG